MEPKKRLLLKSFIAPPLNNGAENGRKCARSQIKNGRKRKEAKEQK